MKLPPLRIQRFDRKQQLQARILGRWFVIDEEDVPEHVLISLGCFGDTGGWTSRFAKVTRAWEGL